MVKQFLVLSIIFIFFFVGSLKSYAQKTDTLFHTNGNVLTGEVKKFTKGLLYFKMDGMGTLKVENEEIKSLISNKFLRILTKHNKVYYGDIDSSNNWGEVRVGLLDERDIIKVNDIVEIFPINNTFWLRLNGRIDLGLDYSKANNMFRVNGSGQVNYRKEKWGWQFKYDNNDSWQQNDSLEHNTKSDIDISSEYLLSPKWRATGTAGRSSNTELGLKARWFTTIAIKNYIVQTNRATLDYVVGISANLERNSTDVYKTNYEIVVGTSIAIFKYQSPDISINAFAQVLPNLLTKGRWRFDSGFDARIELFNNFFLSGKIYYQYDSMPIDADGETQDYSFATGFGYSFN